MREKENNIEFTNDFDNEVQKIIIKMNTKRGRNEFLSAENIKEKMCSINPNKLGELIEFEEQYSISGGELTSDLALEMADIIYYTSQPNCPKDLKHWSSDFEERLGISHSLAQQFCILKYRCRLEHPFNSKDYKKKEIRKMSEFLNNKKLNFLP